MVLRRFLLPILLLAATALPALADQDDAVKKKNLNELRISLKEEYLQCGQKKQLFFEEYDIAHREMEELIEKNDGLPMLLYNQNPAFTISLSWVLKAVSQAYEEFSEASHNYDSIFRNLDTEIDRFKRMSDALLLRNVEPEQEANREACIFYATELLTYHQRLRDSLEADHQNYEEAVKLFNETRDYVKLRFDQLQDYVFKDGQASWIDILSNWDKYMNLMQQDCAHQYSLTDLKEKIHDLDGKEGEWNRDKGERTLLLYGGILMALKLLIVCGLGILLAWCIRRLTPIKEKLTRTQATVIGMLLGCLTLIILHVVRPPKGDIFFEGMGAMFHRFIWLLTIILTSLLFRVKPQQLKTALRLYRPTIFLALAIIVCRVTFMPDTLLTFLLTPILLLACFRQLIVCLRLRKKLAKIDWILGWASFGVSCVALVVALLGFTFVSMLILIWWYTQLAIILAVECLTGLIQSYKEKRVDPRMDKYLDRIAGMTGLNKNSLRFNFTWFYDLVKGVLLPVLKLISIPLCLLMTLNVFDFDHLFQALYFEPFIHLTDNDDSVVLELSLRILILLSCLFFVFMYANKLFHFMWQGYRYTEFRRKHKRVKARSNEINLSLGNSIISVLVWLLYITIAVVLMRIPIGSLGLVAGGLSAGIGLAMKDIINNFIYGIQLMSGRLRVGDYIECDGSRGKVADISYQYTEVNMIDGNSIIFTNSTLFNKTFKNLTRNNPYEYLRLSFTVKYDTDVERARALLKEASKQLMTKDKDGRDVIEPNYGIRIVVDSFQDGGITFFFKQNVLVEERYGYSARAKELIFKTLTENNIEIPFQQVDIHMASEK